MKNFNYLDAVVADVINYIREEVNTADFESREDMETELYDILFTEDSVTGNASGSHTFNAYKAKECVFADPDAVAEALEEFCVDAKTIADKFLSQDWEYFDVTARCGILGLAISTALDSIESELEFGKEA